MASTQVQASPEIREATVGAGSQTLMRGLDVIEVIADEIINLTDLSERLRLTKSTTHRLASALVDRGYLAFTPRSGYRLGPKVLELGHLAHLQADLIQVARPHLEDLSSETGDTVHLGVRDGDTALYLDKMPGRRRIDISSRVGDRQPLSSTGLGKALMIDHDSAYWSERFSAEQAVTGAFKLDEDSWIEKMKSYSVAGHSFDLEENEDQIRCVAAPIRDATGGIVGAISVSSAAQYMGDERMKQLIDIVKSKAKTISLELGWTVSTPVPRRKRHAL